MQGFLPYFLLRVNNEQDLTEKQNWHKTLAISVILKHWLYSESTGLAGLSRVHSSTQAYIMYHGEEMSVINVSSIGVNCKRAFKVPKDEKGN